MTVVKAAALTLLLALCGRGQDFEHVTTYRGLGALVASAVGPGPAKGSERLYLSYLYVEQTIDVVAVDPSTGAAKVFPNPAPTESGARCMAVGPDGNIYLGTLPQAHFLKLDPKAGKLVDLGRPSTTEQYIWDVNFGADGKLYGATYPQSKLVRYDPTAGKLEDLGRMDPVEQYAHYVAGSDDGFMYVGIGTSKANIAVYEIATGQHREILPAQYQIVAQAIVYRGQDGNVYGTVGSQHFRLKGWTATPIDANAAAPPAEPNRLRNGHTVSVSGRSIELTDPKTKAVTEHRFGYQGNTLNVFRVAVGPEGALYASSVLPIHLLKLNARARHFDELGDLGGGEIYSFLAHGKRLLMAAYSGTAPLMILDPSKPFDLKANPNNPVLVNYAGSDSGWRPQALINGPGGKVYIGSVAGYGKLGGPLTVWDPRSGAIDQYPHVVQDQSVVSLAAWKDLIVGGTTIGGGGGSHPTQKEAKIFLWNPQNRQKTFETVPVPGSGAITDLIAAPNGLVYGIAGRTMFVFDPASRAIKLRKPVPFPGAIYNAVALGPDGRIWGLASNGVFAIDTGNSEIAMVAESPKKMTAGFALDGRTIYMVSNAELWRWRIPEKR